MGEEECIRIFGRKSEGTRPIGRRSYRWMDNIKMNLREIGWDNMD
jgi:hypothetical protein